MVFLVDLQVCPARGDWGTHLNRHRSPGMVCIAPLPPRARGFDSKVFAMRKDDRIRVAIVDGSEGTRWSMECILNRATDFKWVGAFRCGEDALNEIPALAPRLILMDIRLPGISGIECMHRLKSTLPGLMVVLASMASDDLTITKALAEGSDGFLAKPFSIAQCLATLRFALRDRYREANRLHHNRSTNSTEPDALTKRENEVMAGLAKGLLYKEIADKLGISFSAVHKRQHRIFCKLHASNRTEAIDKWRELEPRVLCR
jgi:DNA-binding NarL/FixJ family response regulator